jgi:predicted lipoprotein with Yx(FWY)xxD motif
VARSNCGTVLFSGDRRVVYLFDKESTRRPECYGACARAWPPVLTDRVPRASGAARQPLLGTTARTDGSRQVTYAGHPLYYYVHDGPGQVLCHNVVEYGGRWLVVTPVGSAAA